MSNHYYSREGEAMHFVPNKTKGGTRPSTVWDCKKNGWVPSPTTVLKILDKPALIEWKIRNAVAAVMTAPRLADEPLDDFITRVLDTEGQDKEEAAIARDKGTAIHDAIEAQLSGKGWPVSMELAPFVLPVVDVVLKMGAVRHTEKILVNADAGYAGKCDCITEGDEVITVLDFKTCKTVPKKGAYTEHKMQAAAYGRGLGNTGNKRVECVVIYISKESPGEIKVCPVEEWNREYLKFETLLRYWYLANDMPMPNKFESKLPF